MTALAVVLVALLLTGLAAWWTRWDDPDWQQHRRDLHNIRCKHRSRP